MNTKLRTTVLAALMALTVAAVTLTVALSHGSPHAARVTSAVHPCVVAVRLCLHV